MNNNHIFFKCGLCGNLIGLIDDKGVSIMCCGQKMTELIPNTVDASVEKHVPFVNMSECSLNVQVGSIPHPMEAEHYIEFIFVKTEQGAQRKCLKPGTEPSREFCIVDDKATAVYAYCNLHGLWKVDL
ncbi:MAG: desulfoferrodoxin [Oscillospiraceae bacterium]|nr:desulfoferrodoxin [Oscillospiraceae bacterium]